MSRSSLDGEAEGDTRPGAQAAPFSIVMIIAAAAPRRIRPSFQSTVAHRPNAVIAGWAATCSDAISPSCPRRFPGEIHLPAAAYSGRWSCCLAWRRIAWPCPFDDPCSGAQVGGLSEALGRSASAIHVLHAADPGRWPCRVAWPCRCAAIRRTAPGACRAGRPRNRSLSERRRRRSTSPVPPLVWSGGRAGLGPRCRSLPMTAATYAVFTPSIPGPAWPVCDRRAGGDPSLGCRAPGRVPSKRCRLAADHRDRRRPWSSVHPWVEGRKLHPRADPDEPGDF
jgi:hypothetical protein